VAFLDDLSGALSAAIGTAVIVSAIDPVGGGANGATHFRLTCTDGQNRGLKIASRVVNGTRREFLAAWTARELQLPGALRCGMFTVPNGGPASISGREAVAIEWVIGGVPLGAAGVPSVARRSQAVARQVGQWVWLAVGLGVDDRHPGNWIWSEQEQTFAMIDFEDWRAGSQTGASMRNIAEQTLGAPIDDPSAAAILAGMLTAHASFLNRRAAIEMRFTAAGEVLPPALDSVDCLTVARELTGVNQLALPAPPVAPQVDAALLPPQP